MREHGDIRNRREGLSNAAPRRLAVFARPPVAGRVKTRLTPALPPRLACELYAALLADTLDAAAATPGIERCVWWAEPPPPGLLPPGFGEAIQHGDTLGARLADAFERMAPGAQAMVAIGCDAPAITRWHLEQAFEALEHAPAVIGPAADGGYWLIGLRSPMPELFEGITWGGPGVLAQTLAHAERGGIAVTRLEQLEDLDTPADLIHFVAAHVAVSRTPRRRTTATLECMGLLPAEWSEMAR